MRSASHRDRAPSWPALACALCGAAVFQFLGNSTQGYLHTSSLFYWWGYQWVNPSSETEHGLPILVISAWLLARNVRAAPADDGTPRLTSWAAAAMICGMLLHAAGFVAEQARLSIAGLLLFVWGVIALAGGSRWARAAMFPVGFMLFAVPVNALDSAGFWLRMWVVSSSAAIAHGLGIGVLVNGTQLLSPDGRYDYDVAAACSGVRSLVALSALSLVVGYLWLKPLWLRAAMLLACLPLIFIGNVARIVAIVVAAHLGGLKWGNRIHELMGFGVFAIVLGGILAAVAVIARLRPEWATADDSQPERAPAHPKSRAGSQSGEWLAAAAVGGSCALAASLLLHFSHLPPSGRAGIALAADGMTPVDLPAFIGTEWIGRRTEVTEVERQILPADTGFSRRTYVSLDDPAKQVFVSIVLSGRDRTSIHRPELCLVGQGWTILGSFRHQFAYPGRSAVFPATVLKVEKEVVAPAGPTRVPQLVAYYFVGGDAVVATHWERIARDAWNRVIHGRADRWAYVLIKTGDSDGEDAALQRLQLILSSTLPSFQPASLTP